MAQQLIAIVEDNEGIADLLEALLTDELYATNCYYSAAEAYAGIIQEVPALIITDLQMEHHDAGLELLQRLRNTPETAHIPVILYSAAVRYLRQKIKDINTPDTVILEKPFDLHDLLEKIRAAIGEGQAPNANTSS